MATQKQLNISEPIDTVETYEFEPIQGYPMLNWKGKRPFRSTQYYPAQLKEVHGEEVEGWRNKIYWGDNLQVMSHLLKMYRGKITLIYIDPPFDSKAEYKKKIQLRGNTVENDQSAFEEKQYTDIWTNDEYLQFMYERLILMRELLADNGSIYVHCDWRMNGYLRLVLDEVFGKDHFLNELIWCYRDIGSRTTLYFKRKHDTLLVYSKSETWIHNVQRGEIAESTRKRYEEYFDENDQITYTALKGSNPGVFAKLKGIPQDFNKIWLDAKHGAQLTDWWTDISPLKLGFNESIGYPTQKPEALLERIIKASSNLGDLVFDCFMGSGTTQAVAMKLGRRFIGADINLGAVETTSKRLLNLAQEIWGNTAQGEIDSQEGDTEGAQTFYTGFEVYNVNHYDVFRNPVEAKDLLIEALSNRTKLFQYSD